MPFNLEKMQKAVTYAIFFIAIFAAGIMVGRQLEKTQQEERIVPEEVITDLLEPEEAIAAPEELPSKEQPESVSQNATVTASANTALSGNEAVSANQASGGQAWNTEYKDPNPKQTLEQRAAIRNSYEETIAVNAQDQEIIANSTIDFSNMKIACLGDSITEGAQGNTPYPAILKEVLGAKEVINLGKGGSTIASGEGVATMIDRCYEMPQDTDIVVVLGGTNDNFKQPTWQFGFMDWETKGEGTFCGDLQLLMRKFKWNFPDTKVLFVTPPSNSKIDELKAANPSLQSLSKYAEAINYIGAEEHTQVLDLYNANLLNSHNADVMSHFMIDQVHMNTEGNRILAEHVASELIKRFQ